MASDAFEDRKKAHEAKFKLDEELAFKAAARRNRLLGEWLGREFGFTSDEVADYAKDVVVADLEEAGTGDVVRKVMADIEKHGATITEDDVLAKIDEFNAVAREQLAGEFPDALDTDH
jgi:hypothetical protein